MDVSKLCCPHCHQGQGKSQLTFKAAINCETSVDKPKPRPNDPVLCIYCSELCIFDNNLNLRKPTEPELNFFMNIPVIKSSIIKARSSKKQTVCLACNNTYTQLHEESPSEGDPSICEFCGALAVYNNMLKLKRPDHYDILKLACNHNIAFHISKLQSKIKFRNISGDHVTPAKPNNTTK
jgi:hypothetical protein